MGTSFKKKKMGEGGTKSVERGKAKTRSVGRMNARKLAPQKTLLLPKVLKVIQIIRVSLNQFLVDTETDLS